ncbi:hypothetical protein QEH59_13830 [Coraliomargarita sp. SDUM461004]|uniref:Uncharacterized protein n=1 Tax=Thalassobacterium sedimentorum TaxID=3041258 RepID=A0ABU1AL36_9BACT|nr:hypothetical protein [Coraliomargarita sp. SDUM461004]MDQ8195508.1 hypothetical protein [Coraliomargarita sp. SDUM461004]
MSGQPPNPRKYKLSKRSESENASTAATSSHSKTSTQPQYPAPPLQLRPAQTHTMAEDSMRSTADLLEDAYGAETGKRRRGQLLTWIIHFFITLTTILLFAVGTLAYAHVYKAWPQLEPISWYAPFLVVAALSAWICVQALQFLKRRELSLLITGLMLAAAITYWNLYVFEYATRNAAIIPQNGLWAPESVEDLLLTTEINASRGISNHAIAYTQLSKQQYYQTFNSISKENWRAPFQRFLSAKEIKTINSINIQDKMHLVVQRIQEQRTRIWTELQQQHQQPELQFRLRKALLKPYTWALSHLQ